MTTETLMWALYFVSASVGYYCYRCIPTGAKQGGVIDSGIRTFGLVLLFTPVPSSASAIDLAPGFVAIPFNVMQSGLDSVHYAAPWYGATFLVALVLVVLTRTLGLNVSVTHPHTGAYSADLDPVLEQSNSSAFKAGSQKNSKPSKQAHGKERLEPTL